MTEQGAGDTVLVCDYVGRRAAAPVSALRLEERGFTVHYLLKSPYPTEVTAAGYAEELLRRLGPGSRVRAVLAYCAAAPIAQEIAARLGDPVPLVLFDGEPATSASVLQEYHLAAEKLAALLTLPPGESVPAPIPPAQLRTQPRQAVRRMYDGLLELGERAACLDADPVTVRAEARMFADYYLGWLSHLVAAHNTSWPGWGGPAVQVVSRQHECPADWPGATGTRTVRVDAGRDQLLRHPDVLPAILPALHEEVGRAS